MRGRPSLVLPHSAFVVLSHLLPEVTVGAVGGGEQHDMAHAVRCIVKPAAGSNPDASAQRSFGCTVLNDSWKTAPNIGHRTSSRVAGYPSSMPPALRDSENYFHSSMRILLQWRRSSWSCSCERGIPGGIAAAGAASSPTQQKLNANVCRRTSLARACAHHHAHVRGVEPCSITGTARNHRTRTWLSSHSGTARRGVHDG